MKKITVIPPTIVAPHGERFEVKPTETEGVFGTWSGNDINFGYGTTTYMAYTYSADGSRVFYSDERTGYLLTIPEDGTYQLYCAGEKEYTAHNGKIIPGFTPVLLKLPEGKNNWEDDGKGTLTAVVSETPLEFPCNTYRFPDTTIRDYSMDSLRTRSAEEIAELLSPVEFQFGSETPTEEQKAKGLISFTTKYGTRIRDIYINPVDSSKKPTVIAGLCDMHINVVDRDDADDAEIQYTNKTRYWGYGGCLVPLAVHALALADLYDQVVIAGDILDFMSKGAAKMVEKKIVKKYPGILMTPGGHEYCKDMETGFPEVVPYEEKVKFLQSFWPHDIIYHSKLVNDNVLCVVMDNGPSFFTEYQYEKLSVDIKTARENGYTVLVFFHEPLTTNIEEYKETKVLDQTDDPVKSVYDYYSGWHIGVDYKNDTPETMKVYSLITSSADVIKGIFAGHRHYNYYTEIKATDADGNDTVIPQYVMRSCAYNEYGCVTRIFV